MTNPFFALCVIGSILVVLFIFSKRIADAFFEYHNRQEKPLSERNFLIMILLVTILGLASIAAIVFYGISAK